MERPDISIVIVNYNVKDFLAQCLASIEKSSKGLNVETIVVDNDSKDGSVEFLEPVFPEVNFISLDKNLGFGKANNIGFSIAKGRYILILNPDTILEEKTLAIMMEYMESHPEAGMSGCKVLNPDGSFQLACRRGFPTPWASFTKLFGLQKLFPKSKLFSKYNLTYKDIDETYNIDCLIGAFMFARWEVIEELGGFDEDFFMYGEDIDLCYRAKQKGWEIAYVHSASIIHYKGESSRRSSINEIKHFYEAMEIFASKHYSSYGFFMIFLRLGIFIRSILAYLLKNKRQVFVIIADLLSVNFFMMLGAKYKFGSFLGFQDYAYPTVFIVVTAVAFLSMVAVGEYFEEKPTIRKAVFGYLVSFFILSSLTYYFKDYAFSRGVLLFTIGLSIAASSIYRMALAFYDNTSGSESYRNIAIVGMNDKTKKIIEALQTAEARNANIVGLVSVDSGDGKDFGLPVLGNVEYLAKIIETHRIREVIITDQAVTGEMLMKTAMSKAIKNVRYHMASEYEGLLAARIVNEIAGIEPTLPKYNIMKIRYRLAKRAADLIISFLLLTIGLPAVYLIFRNRKETAKKIWFVFLGKYSIIGLYDNGGRLPEIGKPGLTGLAHLSRPGNLSGEAIEKLNVYYLQHYTLSLDLDIIFKYLFRKKNSGN